MRILLVEDEPRAAQMLAKGLREEAYAVDVVDDGGRAVYQAAITDYDAIILDVVLPLQDGLAVCREIRHEGSAVPVLMLTARDAVEARIAGLDSGADDYLTKPFDFGELLARLRAIIRRGRRPPTPSVLRVGPLELDTRARRGLRRGRPLILTAREYALLEHLVLHANEVVGRAALAEHVWDRSLRGDVQRHRRLHSAPAAQDRRTGPAVAHRHAARRRVHVGADEVAGRTS